METLVPGHGSCRFLTNLLQSNTFQNTLHGPGDMLSSLLATKFRVPPPQPNTLPRQRLLDALDQHVPNHRLTVVSAPAGYGKTTLLSQWVHGAGSHSVAWLTLGSEDNDLDRFLRYLVSAWNAVQPGVLDSPVGLLLGSIAPDTGTVLTHFVNLASDRSDALIFVLDNYHLIEEPAIHQSVTFLLDHLPSSAHIVITARGEPDLPLARYRASGDLFELGVQDLQFDSRETRQLLGDLKATDLAGDQIALVQEQLEGWVTGLRLMCHGHRQLPAAAGTLPIGGRQRFVADYLREAVIGNLPATLHRFLMETSILQQLSGSLCDAVTGESGSQQVLEAVEREGLFLAPLDNTRDWYRYHPIFTGVLQEELRRVYPESSGTLHRRAAQWYLDHGMPEPAFDHALAGDDAETGSRIAEDYAVITMESGEFSVVRRWVESVPSGWYERFPPVALLKVVYLVYSGDIAECMRLLDDLEARMRQSRDSSRHKELGKVATARCAIACFMNDLPMAELHAAEAFRELPPDDRFFRSSIHHALGDTYSRNGLWEKAKASLLRSLEIVHEPSCPIRSVHIFGALADLELRQGHLRAAEAYWNRAVEGIQRPEVWGRLPVPVTGWVSIRLAELHYERNRLSDAKLHLTRGLELAELGGETRSQIAGHLISARLDLANSRPRMAMEHLDRARALCEHAQFPEWTRRVDRCLLETWLAQNQLRAAANWADAMPPDGVRGALAEIEIDQLTLARVLIVKNHQADRERALDMLADLIARSGTEGRNGIQIEALILQSLALWEAGDWKPAMTSLEQALTLAEPEGYLRLFADFGASLAPVLLQAVDQQILPEYSRLILDTITADAGSNGSGTMLEPLSSREREVLELIAAGMTNREIAGRLFISAETVKKHTSSIYAKLQVGHRTQAVARARSLGLLAGYEDGDTDRR
ncbi:LuxR C-terminal-related transcriptional regulator [soil metagenome]